MPETKYSAMRGMLAESKIGQSIGAPGLFWEKLMRGEGRETVRDYLQKRANEVAAAAGGLGMKNIISKGLGLGAMALTGGASIPLQALVGGLTAGLSSKIMGDIEVGKLDTSGLDMSKILYGREQAQEAEDTAQSAMNRLIEGVDAQAVSSAFTTPLMYYTLKNTFSGGAPTDGGGTLAGGMQSAADPLSKALQTQSSQLGLNWAQTNQLAKTQMASGVNVLGQKSVPSKYSLGGLGNFLFNKPDNLVMTPPNLQDYFKKLYE